MFKVLSSKEIRSLDESEKIIGGFKKHKRGKTPSYFGRDVGFDYYNTPRLVREYLEHIHLCLPIDTHPRCWLFTNNTYRRTNTKGKPEKDFALIYWFDAEKVTYYLFDVIGPDAHNYDTWMPYLKAVASKAEKIDLG